MSVVPDGLPFVQGNQDTLGHYFRPISKDSGLGDFGACLNNLGTTQALCHLPHVIPQDTFKVKHVQPIADQFFGLLGRGQFIPDNIIESPEESGVEDFQMVSGRKDDTVGLICLQETAGTS